MLEVGAGMCGGSRAVVEKFGTYVTALERDTDLVEIGRAQNVAAGCDDKITLDPLVPSSLGLKKEYFEAALARDALFTIENQQEVLTEIIRSLKPEGQIMLTDLFFDADDDDDALAAWRSAEPEPVHPWTIDAVKDIFAGANVLTRIAADETAAYRTMALATWDDFQYKVKQGTVPAELMDTMLREAEVWTRRMAAMDGGALRYYRVLGVKNS
jgi:ubiquinone/menaquinone biosynthesis C-methylase UbiE